MVGCMHACMERGRMDVQDGGRIYSWGERKAGKEDRQDELR